MNQFEYDESDYESNSENEQSEILKDINIEEFSDDDSIIDDIITDGAGDNNIDFISQSDLSKFNKEIVVIKPENRLSSDIFNENEISEALSIRIDQITKGSIVFVDVNGLTDAVNMAKKELVERRLPLILRRKIGVFPNKGGQLTDYYEYWDPNTMIHAKTYTL